MSVKDLYLSLAESTPNASLKDEYPGDASLSTTEFCLPLAVYLVPSSITVISCIMALTVTFKGKVAQLSHKTTSLVVSLVVSMFLLSSLSLAYLVVLLVLEKATTEDPSACYVKLFQRGLSAVSCFSLTCVALDRYLAICWPLRYHSLVTSTRANLLVACSWIVPCVLLLFACVVDTREFCSNSRHTTWALATYAAMYASGGIVTVILYVLVAWELRRRQEVVHLCDEAAEFDSCARRKTTAAALLAATLCFISIPHTVIPLLPQGLPLNLVRWIHLFHRIHIVLFLPVYAPKIFKAVCNSISTFWKELRPKQIFFQRIESRGAVKFNNDEM